MNKIIFVIMFLMVFSGVCMVAIAELYAENQELKQHNIWFKELSKLDKETTKEIRSIITNYPVI